MADQPAQTLVLAQSVEVIQTLAAQSVQKHDAFHIGGFIESPVAPLEAQVPLHSPFPFIEPCQVLPYGRIAGAASLVAPSP